MRSGSVKKSAAAVSYGRSRRSIVGSRSPAGQCIVYYLVSNFNYNAYSIYIELLCEHLLTEYGNNSCYKSSHRLYGLWNTTIRMVLW